MIFGHAFAAKQHTDNTHNLPLPPNALGDTNIIGLYQQVLDFVSLGRNCLGEALPPVFAHREEIQATENVLKYMMNAGQGCNISLDVYDIYYLFHTLKNATCSQGAVRKPDSIFITDSYFDRDEYEYAIGIGCAVSYILFLRQGSKLDLKLCSALH